MRSKESMVIVWAPCLGSTSRVTLSSFSHDNVSTIKCNLCLMTVISSLVRCMSQPGCVVAGHTVTQAGQLHREPQVYLQSLAAAASKNSPLTCPPPSTPPNTNRRIVMWARLLRSHVTPIVPVQRPFTVFRCDREEFVRALPLQNVLQQYFLTYSSFPLHYSGDILSLFDRVIWKSLIR